MRKCQYYNCGSDAEIQLHGENLCGYHYDIRIQKRVAQTDAMIEQHFLDLKRVEKANEWHYPYKSVLP